jgi:hypothetical protein
MCDSVGITIGNLSHNETRFRAAGECHYGMELAGMVVWFGALGMIVAALNIVALRIVRPDEVPGYVRCRIEWWSAHNSTFLLGSALLALAGLVGLAAL